MTNNNSMARLALVIASSCLLVISCNGRSDDDGNGDGNGNSNGPQAVLLEIDRMTGTRAVEDEQTLGGNAVSMAKIYEAGELNLRIVHDQSDLERQDSIRLADLHALMTANRNVAANEGEWHIHMLVVTEDADDPGTLGIMFDFGDVDDNDIPREAFAVFESAHEGLSGGVVPEVLLTSAHELAHVFNLHHTDWEGSSFQNDATIESYSMTDTVLWRLSDQSIAHLAEHDKRLVRPGPGGSPFTDITQAHLDDHQFIPRESYNVIDASRSTASRGPDVQKAVVIRSQLAKQGSRMVTASDPVKLKIEAPQDIYTVGEPVIVSIVLENTSDKDVQVISQLHPEYRFLSVAIKSPGSDDFLPYRAPVIRDARRVGLKTIEAHGQFATEAKLFFSADGWTFEEPGEYVIQASYPAGSEISDARIESEELKIMVDSPRSESTGSARRLLLDKQGKRLGKEQGLFLYMEGGDHLTYGAGKLKELVDTAPNADQAAAARLALGNAALNPTYDPSRRVRPDANLDEAMKYLEGLPEAENLPAQSIKRVVEQLMNDLEKADRMDDAMLYRRQIAEKLENTTLENET